MKHLLIFFLMLIAVTLSAQSGVLISPDGGTPDAKALLELRSTTQGFLPPRLREMQRDDIEFPPNGLIVFNTNTNRLNVYDAAAGEWTELAPAMEPTARTIILGSAAFTSVDSREEYIKTQGQGGAYLFETTGSGTLVADFQLPVGSRITNVTFYYRDQTSLQELSFRLNRESMVAGFFSPVANVTTGVVNASPDWTSSSMDVNHVVSAFHGYFISAFSTNWTIDLNIKGASITYIPPTN